MRDKDLKGKYITVTSHRPTACMKWGTLCFGDEDMLSGIHLALKVCWDKKQIGFFCLVYLTAGPFVFTRPKQPKYQLYISCKLESNRRTDGVLLSFWLSCYFPAVPLLFPNFPVHLWDRFEMGGSWNIFKSCEHVFASMCATPGTFASNHVFPLTFM